VIAEQNGKIMITTGAASDDAYKQGYTLVFQAYTPASRYLTGAVDLLAQLDPDVKKMAFVYESTTFATSVVEAAKTYAEEQGYEVVLFEGYDAETTDFGPFINRIVDSGAETLSCKSEMYPSALVACKPCPMSPLTCPGGRSWA
jgi:branched-chain amino acid transport system substrate-binding protein